MGGAVMAESLPAEAPTWRRVLTELWIGWRVMLDLGLAAVGAALVGLAAAILLAGFGVVDRSVALSTGGLLGSALVIGIVGAFALGLASEGGLGASPPPPVRRWWRSAAMAAGGVVVGVMLVVVARWLAEPVAELPVVFALAREVVRAAGVGGVILSLTLIPLLWVVREYGNWGGVLDEIEVPLVFTAWTLLVLLLYRVPVT
jgi:hypothetical protein